jgi:organic hydroperoxide reductase OsmC/OhrA
VAEAGVRVELRQQADYRFAVDLGEPRLAPLITDEPPPLGQGAGPNPARLLAVAVANCLSASLLFALRKFGNEPGPLRAVAQAAMERNERGRLRIPRITVEIHLGVGWSELRHAKRALDQFEDYCVVTQSVRGGIDVPVRVLDRDGLAFDAAQPAPLAA